MGIDASRFSGQIIDHIVTETKELEPQSPPLRQKWRKNWTKNLIAKIFKSRWKWGESSAKLLERIPREQSGPTPVFVFPSCSQKWNSLEWNKRHFHQWANTQTISAFYVFGLIPWQEIGLNIGNKSSRHRYKKRQIQGNRGGSWVKSSRKIYYHRKKQSICAQKE